MEKPKLRRKLTEKIKLLRQKLGCLRLTVELESNLTDLHGMFKVVGKDKITLSFDLPILK
jgi:hypothetical protein